MAASGVRICTVCGRERQVPDEIAPRGKRCVECRIAYKHEYYAANREKQREYERAHRARIEADPEWLARERERRAARARERNSDPIRREAHRAAARRYRVVHKDRIAANQKRSYERRKKDPERWQAYLDLQRMNYRLRMERAGKPVRRLVKAQGGYRPTAAQHGGQIERVPAGPFVGWLERTFNGHSSSIEMAAKLGISDHRIRDLLSGSQESVALHTVDRALTAYGDPGQVSVLYPIGDASK
jgi:hypothetical protein